MVAVEKNTAQRRKGKNMTLATWMIVLAVLNLTMWIARFKKPLSELIKIKKKQVEELQKQRMELSKAAEEIALIRKSRGSSTQN